MKHSDILAKFEAWVLNNDIPGTPLDKDEDEFGNEYYLYEDTRDLFNAFGAGLTELEQEIEKIKGYADDIAESNLKDQEIQRQMVAILVKSLSPVITEYGFFSGMDEIADLIGNDEIRQALKKMKATR